MNERINSLKTQIAKLTKEIEVKSEVNPSDFLSSEPLSPNTLKQLQEQEEMEQEFNKMRVATMSKEDTLKHQLLELNSRLLDLNHMREVTCREYKREVEPLQSKLEQLEQALKKLTKEHKTHNNSVIKKMNLEFGFQSRANYSIVLQRRLEEENLQKEKQKKKLEENKEALELLTNQVNMVEEEERSRYFEIWQWRYHKEALRSDLEVDSQDTEYIDTLKEKVKDTREKIWIFEEKTKNSEKKLRELMKRISYAWKVASKNCDSEVLNEWQNPLDEEAKHYETPNLAEMTVSVNAQKGFDIDEAILEIEYETVLQREKELEGESHMKLIKAAICNWKTEVEKLNLPCFRTEDAASDSEIVSEFRSRIWSQLSPIELQALDGRIGLLYYAQNKWTSQLKSKNDRFTNQRIKQSKLIRLFFKEWNQTILFEEEHRVFQARYKRLKGELSKFDEEIESPTTLHDSSCFWNNKIEQSFLYITESLHPFIETSKANISTLIEKVESVQEKIVESEEAISTFANEIKDLQLQKEYELQTAYEKMCVENPSLSRLRAKMETTHQAIEVLEENIKSINEKYLAKHSSFDNESDLLKQEQKALQASLLNIYRERTRLLEMHERFTTQRFSFIEEKNLSPDRPESPLRPKQPLSPENEAKKLLRTYTLRTESEKPVIRPQANMLKLEPVKSDNSPEFIPSPLEGSLIDKLIFLLKGTDLFKKFSVSSFLKNKAFDPLDTLTPEESGYGIRRVYLHNDLDRIEIKEKNKAGIEQIIEIEKVRGPIIPEMTSSIIKIEREHIGIEYETRQDSAFEYKAMKRKGFVDTKSETYKEECLKCTNFPFSLALDDGRLEFIATSIESFKFWISGLNALVDNKKNLMKIKGQVNIV